MDVTSLLIQLVSGVVGGNVAGALAKARSLGPMLNSVLGGIGGIGGGQLTAGAMGAGTATEIGGSAIVGALLPLIVGMFRKKEA